MASSDAAIAQINGIIEHALNTAAAKSADAGLYAEKAINATNGIIYLEGSGDVTAGGGVGLMPLVVSPLQQPPSVDGDGSVVGRMREIMTMLAGEFDNFFNRHFADDAAIHAEAVHKLMALAEPAQAAIDDLTRRLGLDDAAREYINSLLRVDPAVGSRLRESVSHGTQGSDYMVSRPASGTAATAYLVKRFNTGDQAATALINMIISGGTSIPAPVENQVWQRDRARITAEAARAERQGIDQWAARGWPMPPGAVAMMSYTTQKDALDKIAQASRDIAIKQVETLIENIRFGADKLLTESSGASRALLDDAAGGARVLIEDATAAVRLTREDALNAARLLIEDSASAAKVLLQTAQQALTPLIGLRAAAISAAADYLRAVSGSSGSAASIQSAVIDAKSRMYQMMVSYYTAQVGATASYNSAMVAIGELQLKPALASADNRVRLHMAKGSTDVGIAQAKSQAALGAAQAAGNQGAAALSTLNAIAALEAS